MAEPGDRFSIKQQGGRSKEPSLLLMVTTSLQLLRHVGSRNTMLFGVFLVPTVPLQPRICQHQPLDLVEGREKHAHASSCGKRAKLSSRTMGFSIALVWVYTTQ